MQQTLHLRPAERAMFEKLPADLQEGWKVTEEKQQFADNAERVKIRFQLLTVEDKNLRDLLTNLQGVQSADDIKKLMDGFDPSGVSDQDTREFFFAIGPDGVTMMLMAALSEAKNDEDVKHAAELSLLRHDLLESFQSFTS